MLEVGGGIRSEDDVRELLEAGIDRLILGSVFAHDPDILRRWSGRFGRRFIAGIDAAAGEVKTSGWTEGSGRRAEELARAAAGAGAVSVIYTNIEKDGTLSGPDIEGTVRIGEAAGLPVILSGGIGGMEDLAEMCRRRDPGIRGVIVGKALYEGRIGLEEALAACPNTEEGIEIW